MISNSLSNRVALWLRQAYLVVHEGRKTSKPLNPRSEWKKQTKRSSFNQFDCTRTRLEIKAVIENVTRACSQSLNEYGQRGIKNGSQCRFDSSVLSRWFRVTVARSERTYRFFNHKLCVNTSEQDCQYTADHPWR